MLNRSLPVRIATCACESIAFKHGGAQVSLCALVGRSEQLWSPLTDKLEAP